MLGTRLDGLSVRVFRLSPRFKRFLATRWAVVLAVLVAVVGVVGSGVAAWRSEWLDAAVRLALAVNAGAWAIWRLRRPR